MTPQTINQSMTRVQSSLDSSRTLTVSLEGRLDARGTSLVWGAVFKKMRESSPEQLVIDASQIEYCDGSGISLFLELKRYQKERGKTWAMQGLAPEYQALLKLYTVSEFAGTVRHTAPPTNIAIEIGKVVVALWAEIWSFVTFIGELGSTLFQMSLHPRLLRWKDTILAIEKAGVNALPIIALVGFLIGLIMSFQSAIPMRQFGAEIFVANLVSMSLFRELGPLMTAIIFAGRSGAAFAAEIGTMKVNEEVNALTTMGIDPIRFLVVTRVLASALMTPLLTVFANLCGLIGGAVVFVSLGFPLVTYLNQIEFSVTYVDLLGGLFKSFVFGILIAAVSCFRGLRTRSGASAVGDSTTQAVVSSMVLIVIMDGVFSIIYHYLEI
jgi:phospholipid/cholesterol/gamma-HCH transport system permease protein